MEDNEIIELFFGRSEQALAAVQNKYGRLCSKISYNILHNREDAEEVLAKYPADSIFEIFTFQKVDPAADEPEPGEDNDNRNP